MILLKILYLTCYYQILRRGGSDPLSDMFLYHIQGTQMESVLKIEYDFVQDMNFNLAGIGLPWLFTHSVSVSVSVYVCLSTLLLPTMLVFHVTHSIPSKTAAGQGYTGTKEKQKFSCCEKKKNRNSGYHSFFDINASSFYPNAFTNRAQL